MVRGTALLLVFVLMPPAFADTPGVGRASGNLLVNGDFEQAAKPPSAPLPGWNIAALPRQARGKGVQIMLNGPEWPGAQNGGRQAVDLGSGGTSIFQEIATNPGRIYRLTFQARLDWKNEDLLDTIVVAISDTSNRPGAQTFHAGADPARPKQWQEHAFTFTARGIRTRIQFARGRGPSPGVGLDNVAITEEPPEAAVDITGEWLDSQGNRIRIADSAGSVTLSSIEAWSFVVNDTTTVRAELRLEGSRSGRDLRLAQATTQGGVVFNGRVGAGGFIRATMQLPSVNNPVEFALARYRPSTAGSDKRPRKVHLDLLKRSVEIGKWIPMYVTLVTADGQVVAPERDVEVRLGVTGGRPIPPVVRLTPSEYRVPAGIAMTGPGAQVTASGPGLEPGRASADGCAKGEIQRIRMSIISSRAPADGQHHLPVTVTFLGADDRLVTNGFPKPIGWRLDGVGELRNLPDAHGRPQDIAVAEDECVSRNEVVSKEAGAAIVAAGFRSFTEKATLNFTAPLTAGSVLFALFGAFTGGVVSALRNYGTAVRWRPGRWLAWLLLALAGGVALYLAYYYGVLARLPAFPGGEGFAFLAGLGGGFLGAAALERVAGVLLPRQARAGKA